MAEKDGGSGFAVGFLVGAVLGLAIGFLFAPRSGAETRELLKEKAAVARERAAEVVQRVKEAAKKAQTETKGA